MSGPPKSIPSGQREAVKSRDGLKCCRCGTPTRHGQWHHRRGRRVRDEHTHCTCNGIWLCDPCHDWVHEHPFEAKSFGFIVSRQVPFPGGEVLIAAQHGVVHLTCDGQVSQIGDD